MSARLREIVRRRRLLVALATEQRGELAVQAAGAATGCSSRVP